MSKAQTGGQDRHYEAGKRNLITDVPGLMVGNAENRHIKTGTTVLSADRPFLAAVDVMGGSPGTRETDCLAPDALVDQVDALVLSGGSAFGLSAACGVSDSLREAGRGYPVGPVRVPIVPAAILFDLLNGGDKQWQNNPYPALGRQAFANRACTFDLGTAGAGAGATTANLKGGLGSASLILPSGHTVGALVAANPHGSVVSADGCFHAARWEVDDEFGGRGVTRRHDPLQLPSNQKLAAFNARAQTTLVVLATDADLDKAQLKRLAVSAQDGIAYAIEPSHTLFDGDLVFSLSTRDRPITDQIVDMMLLGHAAAVCVARATARGIYAATPEPEDILACWNDRF